MGRVLGLPPLNSFDAMGRACGTSGTRRWPELHPEVSMDSGGVEVRSRSTRASVTHTPAICVYAAPELAGSVIFTLLKDRALEVHTDWAAFRSNLLTAESAICVLVSLQTWVWTDLLSVRSHRSALALMVITEYSCANSHALARAEIVEVLFLDEITPRSLTGGIAGLARRSITRLAAAALRENHGSFDTELAETLARACTSQRLVRSVDDLARLMGYSRSTLWSRSAVKRSLQSCGRSLAPLLHHRTAD